jgi:uncharacterized protein (DUF3084 family)
MIDQTTATFIVALIGALGGLYTVMVKPRADRVNILEGRLDQLTKDVSAAREELGVVRGELVAKNAKIEAQNSELAEYRACPYQHCPFRVVAQSQGA